MLLRRVIEHVRAQNWTAVGIDFVIVVVGVFIGIQVSNWNDARLQRNTEKTYIQRVQADLLANQEDISQRLLYFEEVRDSAVRALQALNGPTENLGEEFLIDIYTASHILPREFGRDTYDEILSVGANNAVSDIETRKRLANYYRSIQAQLTSLKVVTPYREIIRRNLPYSVHRAISTACGDDVTTGPLGEPIIRLKTNCDPRLSPEEVTLAIAEIKALDIRKDLARQLIDMDSKLRGLRLMRDRAILLDEYLAAKGH